MTSFEAQWGGGLPSPRGYATVYLQMSLISDNHKSLSLSKSGLVQSLYLL